VTIKKYLPAAGGCLWVFTSGVAIAQPPPQCSHASGYWTDNYGMLWSLTQQDVYITGSVYTNYMCGAPIWGAGGSAGSGYLSLIASNPYWGDYCATYFTYEGTLWRGGCNVASGDWNNDYGYLGTFVMSKACEIPPYETTTAGGNWLGPHYKFIAQVSDTSGGNLSGRKYRETNYATGFDRCWHWGSPVMKFEGITQPNPFNLGSSNTYTDEIGWGTEAIKHYRNHGDAPCNTTLYQQMQIACGAEGVETYHYVQNNVLVAEIGVTTLTVTRDGVPKVLDPYPTPP